MRKFKNTDIGQLAHQLTLSPRRHRLRQIAGAERLLELVDADKHYPYDFVCFHLTGYRPLRPSKRSAIPGATLIADVVRLLEHLSQSAAIPVEALPGPVHTQEQLSQRLSVSMKTISRWRQRGLSGLRVVDRHRVSRLVFTEQALRRFVARNRELVLKGGSFRQLTEEERRRIVERAADLVSSRRLKLQDVARIISEETQRAVETIRYTLRRHDRANPNAALFASGGRPKVPEFYEGVYRAFLDGGAVGEIAQQQDLPVKRVDRICREMRAYDLLNRKISYVYHPEYDAPDAHQRILGRAEPSAPESDGPAVRPPSAAPAYLRALYEVPLLTQDQERDLFRRYNFCKYQAHALVSQLEPCKATNKQLKTIDRCLQQADHYQNRLIQANLRLVVSIANRHVRRGDNMFELISDGNMSLMRAVDRFDFSRGFKFSTYASWAIMKNYARTIPEQRQRYARYVTGRDELLDTAADANTAQIHEPAEKENLRLALARGMSKLDQREREILTCHFGLGQAGRTTTLEQLGDRFGVTKERIRQIEKRALAKLKKLLPSSLTDYAEAS